MFIFNFSEENLDYELDPLYSEPKRIRKKQDKCSCSQCKYCAKTTSSLQRHFKIKHEELRYPCSKCEYSATKQVTLRFMS